MAPQDFAQASLSWTPPISLNRGLPREVELSGAAIALLLFCAVLLGGGIWAGLAIDRAGQRQQAAAHRLQVEGRDTEGLVTRLWQTGGRSNEYRVAYDFTAEGFPASGHATISRAHWRALQIGSPLSVRYLPSDPNHNSPTADPPRPVPRWFAVFMGGIFALLGIVFPSLVWRQWRLLRDGRPAPGQVVRTRLFQNKNGSNYVAYYEFPVTGAGMASGRYNSGRTPPAVGSVICILYDPENPRRNATYPMKFVKVRSDFPS